MQSERLDRNQEMEDEKGMELNAERQIPGMSESIFMLLLPFISIFYVDHSGYCFNNNTDNPQILRVLR